MTGLDTRPSRHQRPNAGLAMRTGKVFGGILLVLLVAGLMIACTSQSETECEGVPVPYAGSLDLARTPDPSAEDGYLQPSTLEEALAELGRMLPEAATRSMHCGTEEEMSHYHFGLGRWMRNQWGLWAESALADHLRESGLVHADDMSGVILHSYWRKLHHRPIDLEEQVEGYKAYWEAHVSPDAFTCPNTGTPTEPYLSFPTQSPPKPWIVYHVVDCGDGILWSYERTEGWRPASKKVLQHVVPKP